jgi:hypothetical protein
VLPLVQQMSGHRWRAVWVLGLALSVLGGIAPLLLPNNEYLPVNIRVAHAVEISISNCLFGLAVTMLLVRRERAQGPLKRSDGSHRRMAVRNSEFRTDPRQCPITRLYDR